MDLVDFLKRESNLENIKDFFQKGNIDFQQRYLYNGTFLHYFTFPNLEITQFVFENLHDQKIFYKKDNKNNTFLYNYNFSNLEITKYVFQFLKENCPDIFEKRNDQGMTFFHFIWRCDLLSLEFMFEFFKQTGLMEMTDIYGNTFLHYNINFDAPVVAKYSIDFVKENYPDVLSKKNKNGDTFLHYFLGCDFLKINLDTHLSNITGDSFVQLFHDENFLKKNYLDIKTLNVIRYKNTTRWNNKKTTK